MTITFYPNEEAQKGSIEQRIELLLEAAEHYKAAVLGSPQVAQTSKANTPRDQQIAFNWEEIAIVLREIRELEEGEKTAKMRKSILLIKLAEVYEVLRAAKMSKLEAVRMALMSEANQLSGGSAPVA